MVCASWLVASKGFATWMIARAGSTMRKYTTALTFTDTLSREMTSCVGTSSTTTRRSTLTMRCTSGMRMMRPGPFTPVKRPNVKITPRSYSLRILKICVAATASRTTTKAMMGRLIIVQCS